MVRPVLLQNPLLVLPCTLRRFLLVPLVLLLEVVQGGILVRLRPLLDLGFLRPRPRA